MKLTLLALTFAAVLAVMVLVGPTV